MSNVYNLINQLDSAVNSFEDKVNVHVQNVDTTTQRIQATTGQVYQKVQQFRDDLMKGEEKQIAHENIIRLDQVIKEQFGNYEEIRKTIIGVVRDFDINLVRNDTIEELSEELWITSSRYWLSEVRPMGSSMRAQRWASRKASGRRVLRRRQRRSAVATHWVRPCSSL